MNDFFDDYDDFDDGDFDGDFMDEEPDDLSGSFDDDDDLSQDEAESDDGFEPDWQDIAIIGGLAEEITEERRERQRIQREMDKKD